MWAVKTPNGPSIRLHVQNIHTMDELKMTGNCLKGSRGLLSFDAAFDQDEHWRLTKELFTHVSTVKYLHYIFLTSVSNPLPHGISTDIWRAAQCTTFEAFHRPHSQLFHP